MIAMERQIAFSHTSSTMESIATDEGNVMRGWLFRSTQHTKRMKKRFCILDPPHLMSFRRVQFPYISTSRKTHYEKPPSSPTVESELYMEFGDSGSGCELTHVWDLRDYRISACAMPSQNMFMIMLIPLNVELRAYIGASASTDRNPEGGNLPGASDWKSQLQLNACPQNLTLDDLLWRKEVGIIGASGGNAFLQVMQNRVMGGDLDGMVVCGHPSRTVAQLWLKSLLRAIRCPKADGGRVSCMLDRQEITSWCTEVPSSGPLPVVDKSIEMLLKCLLPPSKTATDKSPSEQKDHPMISLSRLSSILEEGSQEDDEGLTTDMGGFSSSLSLTQWTDPEGGDPADEATCEVVNTQSDSNQQIKIKKILGEVGRTVQKSMVAKVVSNQATKTQRKVGKQLGKLQSATLINKSKTKTRLFEKVHDRDYHLPSLLSLSMTIKQEMEVSFPINLLVKLISKDTSSGSLWKNLGLMLDNNKAAPELPTLGALLERLFSPPMNSGERQSVGFSFVASISDQFYCSLSGCGYTPVEELLKVEGVTKDGSAVPCIDIDQRIDLVELTRADTLTEFSLVEGPVAELIVALKLKRPSAVIIRIPGWYLSVACLKIETIISVPSLESTEHSSQLNPFKTDQYFCSVSPPLRLSAYLTASSGVVESEIVCTAISATNKPGFPLPFNLLARPCICITISSQLAPLSRPSFQDMSREPLESRTSFLRGSYGVDSVGTGEDAFPSDGTDILLDARTLGEQAIDILGRLKEVITAVVELLTWRLQSGRFTTVYWLLVGFICLYLSKNTIGSLMVLWSWYVMVISIGRYLSTTDHGSQVLDIFPIICLLIPTSGRNVLDQCNHVILAHRCMDQEKPTAELCVHASLWCRGFRGKDLDTLQRDARQCSDLNASELQMARELECRDRDVTSMHAILTCVPPRPMYCRTSAEMTLMTLVNGLFAFNRLLFITLWGGRCFAPRTPQPQRASTPPPLAPPLLKRQSSLFSSPSFLRTAVTSPLYHPPETPKSTPSRNSPKQRNDPDIPSPQEIEATESIDFFVDAFYFILNRWPGGSIMMKQKSGGGDPVSSMSRADGGADEKEETMGKQELRRCVVLVLGLMDKLMNFWRSEFHVVMRLLNYVTAPWVKVEGGMIPPRSDHTYPFDVPSWARLLLLSRFAVKGLLLTFFVPLNYYLLYLGADIITRSWHLQRLQFWDSCVDVPAMDNIIKRRGKWLSLIRRIEV
eukprot:GHVH01005992.1.p1 GENE.GHVH01005992.1~~GHVH01005992.1.p1  ORF type:complete len:1222 (+),score=194.57 GHVH01005992.1:17-3682(+)